MPRKLRVSRNADVAGKFGMLLMRNFFTFRGLWRQQCCVMHTGHLYWYCGIRGCKMWPAYRHKRGGHILTSNPFQNADWKNLNRLNVIWNWRSCPTSECSTKDADTSARLTRGLLLVNTDSRLCWPQLATFKSSKLKQVANLWNPLCNTTTELCECTVKCAEKESR